MDQNQRLIFETRVEVAPELCVLQQVGAALLDVAASDGFWFNHRDECCRLFGRDDYFTGWLLCATDLQAEFHLIIE